jgi:hypothetical protein
MASRCLTAALVVAMLTCGSLASADPSAAEKETARGLMTEGRTARDNGDLQGALKAFTAADAIMHVPTTGLELARALVAVGRLVEGRDVALRVTQVPERPNEPAPFKNAREAAVSLGEELDARIPSITIVVKNAPDGSTPEVDVDGTAMPPEVLGKPRKLDPGHHVVTAKAAGLEGKRELDVAEKESKDVSIELPAPGTPTEAATDEPPAAEESTSRGNKVMIFGGFGLAAAGLITGSITGVVAISKANSIKGSSACEDGGTVCGTSVDGNLSTGKTMATVSTVSFIVAGVGAAIGITGFFVGGSSTPAAKPADAPETSAARVVPWIGIGSAGVRGTF